MDTAEGRQNGDVHVAARKTGSPVNIRTGSSGTLVVVFVSLLVDLLGFTVILPLIPSMLDYYSTRDEVHLLVSHSIVALVVLTLIICE